jgi:hypothetical protein
MQPFPLMNRATLNAKEAEDGGAISRGLEFRDVHVPNFIISNLIFIFDRLDTEQMPLRLACVPQSLTDCSTVDLCYYTS